MKTPISWHKMPENERSKIAMYVVRCCALWFAFGFVAGFGIKTALGAERGIASVYSRKEFPAGKTASGIKLDDSKLTAAHRTLPFGTKVKVTNTANGRSITVTIIDRGPFVRRRIIDLTPAGAHALGFCCLANVRVDPAWELESRWP